MKYPKILLTGGTGQVGYELRSTLESLGEIWAPSRLEFDLADPESLREKLRNHWPDLIVNPAAYTAVDRAESEPELARAINAEAPGVLAEEACEFGIPLIHYSTDYVFDGAKTGPYTEDDIPNPLNVYGKTKLEGERAIRQVHDQHLILRTSWVYSPTRGKNFYRTMLGLFQEKEEIRVVDDQIGTPTSAQFLAKKTAWILGQLKTKGQGEDRWGTYHLTQDEAMSWYAFAKRIIEKERTNAKPKRVVLHPISREEYAGVAARPQNSVLNSLKLKNFL
uniref:dTDP-4-dehydrorhamnose reductase n=1 Tax=Candidatus Kentrum sp. UNK TaxID=2126344 RepID=A0A451A8H8_9GAMM|nr:MAG: dTDP-4-dehydrorhamnose reductase [Candidatus Kentron sp. UNK]VFK70415.1 MAG: dTDP-4-dehydrorhamnose reductase [Candidatus Kentron sp. UNK]